MSAGQEYTPVFLVGTAKSGTSFLYSLFDSHPHAACVFETALLHLPLEQAGDRAALLEFFERLATDLFRQLDREEFSRHLDRATAAGPPGYREIYAALVGAVLAAEGKEPAQVTHAVEKTPNHYRHAGRLFAEFPNARVIHVLRDPRDNYLALKRRMRDPSTGVFQNAGYHPVRFLSDRLLDSLECACANAARFGPERYRLLRYEELIDAGEALLREVVEWLGLPWHETLLRPTRRGEPWGGNSTDPELKGRMAAFDRRAIGRWPGNLAPREVRLLEQIILAYRLEECYPVTRSGQPAGGELARLLAAPFADELGLELRAALRGWRAGYRLPRAAWFYGARRWRIYRLLRERRRGADPRLSERCFTAPAAGVAESA